MLRRITAFLFSILALTPALAAAQLASATSLVGTVTDSSNAAMPGVTVTAVNDATHDTYHAVTNGEGSYTLPFVRIGTYTITVEAEGFETVKRSGVVVQTNQTVRTNITIAVSGVTQEVTVSASQPLMATDDASISEVLTTKTIEKLPIPGRDVLKLATITAGVRLNGDDPNGVPPGETFTGGGVRSIQNDISLDGISLMNNLITTVNFRPSSEAVSEMTVQTGTYSAQYGNYMGVHMNVVTKSGTNDPHGAIYEYVRNDALDARGFFDSPSDPKNPLRQNQFGAEVDGPLRLPGLYEGKNKTFFMGAYEGLRLDSKTTDIQSVFTPAMRQGDFSELASPLMDPLQPGATFAGNVIPQSRLSPQALNLLKFMPLPNAPGTVDNFINITATQNNWDQFIGRVDHNVTDAVRLSVRYSYLNGRPSTTSLNPYDGDFSPNKQSNFLASYTHTLTPTMVNDFRVGRNKVDTNTVNIFYQNPALQGSAANLGIPGFQPTADNPGLPTMTIADYQTLGDSGTNWFQKDETWQFSDNLSLTHGPHSFMLGAEFMRVRTDRAARNDPRGAFDFTGEMTGAAAADFLLGLPRNDTTGAPEVFVAGQQSRNAFFALDKWDVNRKLTLNLGLRYEIPTVPTTPTGNATVLNADQTALIPADAPQPGYKLTNPDHNNWAPRLGFAYRASDAWVVRGGAGLYYNPNQTNSYTLLVQNPPFSTIYTFNSDPKNPTVSLANPTPSTGPATAPAPNIVTVGPDWPTAMMRQWSFDVERSLWNGAALDVQYIGSSSRNLDTSFYVNTPLPGPGSIQARRPNPQWGNIRWLYNQAIANYNAMNVVLRQRETHGLSFLATYTWSHALDESDNSNNGGRPMNPYDFRADYGNANWDMRHRFTISYAYDLPFFMHGDRALLRGVLGGWQAAGVTTIESGLPFNVTVSGDLANTGSPNQRPNLVGPVDASCGNGQLANCIASGAFAMPDQYTYGTAGRNLLFGPGSVNTDLSLRKNVALDARLNLRIGVEAFNLFNHPTFANPRAVFGTETFGSINEVRGNARQLQLSARLSF